MKNRKIISIDFDGTIFEHMFPEIGPPIPGAVKWIKRFRELGACLILLTMRSNRATDQRKYLDEAIAACRFHGLEFDYHNDNPTQNKWTTSRKIYSHIHIDDTNACCPLTVADVSNHPSVDWDVVGPWVERQLLDGVMQNPIVPTKDCPNPHGD